MRTLSKSLNRLKLAPGMGTATSILPLRESTPSPSPLWGKTVRPFPLWGKVRMGAKALQTRVALRNQQGFTMVETVASIAVLSITTVALMGAISTGSLGYRVVDRQVTAVRLAVTQMENTKSYTPYLAPPASYPTVTPPTGFGLAVLATSVSGRDPNTLEKITVTVTHNGSTLKVLEGYKAIR